MGYFENVTPPNNTQQLLQSIDKFEQIKQILNRLEKRALEVIEERYPYMHGLTQTVIIDPYIKYSPDDHKQWIAVLCKAESNNRELYSRLFYLRGTGTKLIRNKKWGFIFEPVIGQYGWDSMDLYKQEIACLNAYSNELIDLLQEVSRDRTI